MGKTMLFIIIIGMLLFAGISFVVYKYIDGLASGWGNGTPSYDWNLTVNSYDELIADKGNIAHLEYVLKTRLQGSYKMETKVYFNTVTKENIHITVTITNVRVPEDATEENFDPEWHMQNAENRIDDTFLPKKNQSWSITPQQKECVINIMRERVTFIKDADITIIDDLGKDG